MCSGKKAATVEVPTYTSPQVDPTPTNVSSSDVDVSDASSKQKKKRGRSSNDLSTDRDTILGSAASNNQGARQTLG